MSLHGVLAHGEKVKAVGAYEAQVVVCSQQVINHCPLILVFFPTPHAEGKSTMPLQGLWQMNAPKPIILGDSVGTTSLKKWMSLWEALAVLMAVLSSHQPDHSSMDFGT